jgi:anion-transporting  ArsA/GET3 family ATPase
VNPDLRSLLDRRLLIVTGKGGTGKTSVAAALGLLAAGEGLDTAVVEVGSEPLLPRLLGGDPTDAPTEEFATQPTWMAPHLSTLRIVPRVAFEEYVGIQLHIKALARALVRNAPFQHLLDAAPGWRELITLGKLWHLTTLLDGDRPRWQLIVVDAPASGHGLSFLSVPSVVIDAVRLGPLRRHTERVQELLQDPERTCVLPVTLPEELPVAETLELCERLRALGLAAGPLIANGVESAPALADTDATLAALASLPEGEAPSPLVEPAALAQAFGQRLARAALQRDFLERLDRESGLPHLELPYLTEGIDGPAGIRRLAHALASVPGPREAAA